MKNVRMIIVAIAGLIAFGFWVTKADADIYFEDGQTHIIDYGIAGNEVQLRDGPNGAITTVFVKSGGWIQRNLSLFHSSEAYIEDGWLGASLHEPNPAYQGGHIHTYQTSSCTISGGTIEGSITAMYYGKFIISGGIIGGPIISGMAYDDGSTGFIDNAEITIIGHNFNYPAGIIAEDSGTLTGTLANGDPINTQFQIYDNSKIIIVLEPIEPPVADAGPDQTVTDADDNGSEQVTLNGSGSSDSDGTILSWVWTDDLGNTIPDGEITTAALSVGIHTITLTVTDNDGLTDTDTVTVTVEPYPFHPPVANADGPYTIYVGDTLTLDASGSTDEDNDIVSYLWDLDDNNSFETDAGDQPVYDVNFAYLQSIGLLVDNIYNIHLKVTDSAGQSDVNDSTLTILPIPALQVFVDIKPGSCPNPVNVKSSGVLPIAILGTNDYDVTTIDPTSIRLAGVEPLRSGYEDVGTPVLDSNDCNCTTEGPDGLIDLTLKFKTKKIVEAIGDVNNGDVLILELTGVLFDPEPFETPIFGSDCIVIHGKHKPCYKADMNEDGVVDTSDFAIFAQSWLQSSIVED